MDLTIVIPSYNRKALLRHTLNSIKRSPIAGVPIVVVDNASTDGTSEFLESYCNQNPDVTSVFEPNRNAAAARNRGLSMVSTRWVYFFDSDDEFEDIPHEWDTEAQMVAFPTRQMVDNKVNRRAFYDMPDPAIHILNGMLSTQSMIFRTSWLREIGGWNPSCLVWDDWELGARALMANPRIDWITCKAYHTIKVHPDSLTGPNFRSRYKPQLDTIRQVLDCLRSTDTPDAARCRKALMLRTYILSGNLLHEGEQKGSALCRTFIDDSFGARPDGWILGRILEQYTAMGGRGAWRLAIWKMKRKSV